MDGMEIIGVVDKSEVYGNTKIKPFFDEIVKDLETNPGKAVELKVNTQGKKDVKKKVRTLRTQLNHLGNIGNYNKITFVIKNDDNKYRLFALYGDESKKRKTTKRIGSPVAKKTTPPDQGSRAGNKTANKGVEVPLHSDEAKRMIEQTKQNLEKQVEQLK